jgi:hypothetical protein
MGRNKGLLTVELQLPMAPAACVVAAHALVGAPGSTSGIPAWIPRYVSSLSLERTQYMALVNGQYY